MVEISIPSATIVVRLSGEDIKGATPNEVRGLMDLYELLETKTASASASLDFGSGIGSNPDFAKYDKYIFELTAMLPATDDALLFVRFSSNGGSSFDSGANYGTAASASSFGEALEGNVVSDAENEIRIAPRQNIVTFVGWSNVSTEPFYATVVLYNPSLAAQTVMKFEAYAGANAGSGSGITRVDGAGKSSLTTDVDGVQFLMSTGNITSGTIKMYGFK